MTDAPLYCPICHGQLLSRDSSIQHEPERAAGEKFYCPSCEMFVEPALSRGAGLSESPDRDDPEFNRGRTSQGGTNAGGSQRGDLSDEGATHTRPNATRGRTNLLDRHGGSFAKRVIAAKLASTAIRSKQPCARPECCHPACPERSRSRTLSYPNGIKALHDAAPLSRTPPQAELESSRIP